MQLVYDIEGDDIRCEYPDGFNPGHAMKVFSDLTTDLLCNGIAKETLVQIVESLDVLRKRAEDESK
jgi:hypothetical protein